MWALDLVKVESALSPYHLPQAQDPPSVSTSMQAAEGDDMRGGDKQEDRGRTTYERKNKMVEPINFPVKFALKTVTYCLHSWIRVKFTSKPRRTQQGLAGFKQSSPSISVNHNQYYVLHIFVSLTVLKHGNAPALPEVLLDPGLLITLQLGVNMRRDISCKLIR
jgi:hypothetical protein